MFVVPSVIILFSTIGVLTHYFTSENALSVKRRKGHQRLSYLVFALWITFLASNLPQHFLEFGYGLVNRSEVVSNAEGYNREQTFMFTLVFSWSIYFVTPILYFFIYKHILKYEMTKSGNKTCLFVCTPLNWVSDAQDLQRAATKTQIKCTLKSMDDFDVENSEFRYLLQNLGLLEPSSSGKGSSLREGTLPSITTTNESERENSLSARIRKISQPLLKRKSTVTTPGSISDPYLLQSNEHFLHTLNQKSPLLEREMNFPKRKMTLATLLEKKSE